LDRAAKPRHNGGLVRRRLHRLGFSTMLDHITPADGFAVLFFIFCWAGYTLFADRRGRAPRTVACANLMNTMHEYRLRWMKRMLERENRMADVTIIATQMRSVSLFASTTIFIIGGLVAILGAVDEARAVAAQFPLIIEQASAKLWDLKVLMLLVIFAYAFFKFAWSLRQFNYVLSLIGAAPLHDAEPVADDAGLAGRMARVATLAVLTFNRGVRAYYFGLAALTWAVNPLVFMVATLWVVLVLYRREFHSFTLKALNAPAGDPGGDPRGDSGGGPAGS